MNYCYDTLMSFLSFLFFSVILFCFLWKIEVSTLCKTSHERKSYRFETSKWWQEYSFLGELSFYKHTVWQLSVAYLNVYLKTAVDLWTKWIAKHAALNSLISESIFPIESDWVSVPCSVDKLVLNIITLWTWVMDLWFTPPIKHTDHTDQCQIWNVLLEVNKQGGCILKVLTHMFVRARLKRFVIIYGNPSKALWQSNDYVCRQTGKQKQSVFTA